MILSDTTIKSMVADGRLAISEDVNKLLEAVGPASLDCRLSNVFKKIRARQQRVLTGSKITMAYVPVSMGEQIEYETEESDTYVIAGRSFVLATTEEYLKIPDDMSAYVEGRSSVGRMGLFVQNAGYIDPGFEGKITLELFNANPFPIKIFAGRRICQIVFFKLDKRAEKPYNGKYKYQNTTTESRIHSDVEVQKA